MKSLTTKIKDIRWDSTNLYIDCESKNLKLDIIEGSVDITIKNNNDDIVGINYLEKNDIIKVLYSKKDNGYIKPIKIYVNTKYDFNSESSDSEKLY